MPRNLEVLITANARQLHRELQRAGKAGETFGRKVQIGARVAGAALAGGLAVAAKVGFDELVEGQKVLAQTNAVLKSTGGVANVTAEEITGLAEELARMTGIDDELIQSGENLLLTFKQIQNTAGEGNDIFNQATEAALDLSVALGKDMTSASLMVGKALNDPIRGLTALGRAGVQFTDAQKETIKSLVESGNVLEAQKIILAELQSQVGGSAEAYGDTLPGKLGKARIAFEEMTASIMLALLPAMTAITAAAQRAAEWMEKHPTLARAITVAMIALAAALLAASSAQLLLNLAILANPFVAAAVALAALTAGVVIAYQRSETFRRVVQLLAGVLMTVIGILPTLALLASRHFGTIKAVGVGAFNAVLGAINGVIGAIKDAIGWLQTLKSWLDRITPNFGSGAPGFKSGPTDRGGNPRLGRSGTSGFGRAGAQTVNLHLDGRQIASAVRTADGRWAMQNG